MKENQRSSMNSQTIKRYTDRLQKYGVSKDTLGWHKGKQDLRYEALIRPLPSSITSICDVGCGFGDGIPIISRKFSNLRYTGIDIVTNFISECRSRYPEHSFIGGDYADCLPECEAVIASGIFNHSSDQNYDEIKHFIKCCKRAGPRYVSFDLLSYNVDFRTKHNHYSEIDKVVEIINAFSRRFNISHLDQPFEYSVFIDFWDDVDPKLSRYLHD